MILKSHPNKALKDHLYNVGLACRNGLQDKKIDISIFMDFEVMVDIAYLLGISHDIGKATNYFQDYLNESDYKVKASLKSKPETHHGTISAIFAYYLIREYLVSRQLSDQKFYEYLPILCFLVVKRHHGNLKNASDELLELGSDKDLELVLERQLKSMPRDTLYGIYNELLLKLDFKFDFTIFENALRLEDTFKRSYNCMDKRKRYQTDLGRREKDRISNLEDDNSNNLFYYFITLLFYSFLLEADKMDAAEIVSVKRKTLSEDTVDRYKCMKFKEKSGKMDKIREDIYSEVVSGVNDIDLANDRIFSLNVPTGTGKTLTSLSFALKLRKRLESEMGYSPRIIYSLPFLSIIDQNYYVFEDVLNKTDGKKPGTDILLKHHHLSEVFYNLSDNEFEDTEKEVYDDLLLIEGWNSEIIVTTFIQFFHSIISNRNRMVRKFHNIVNSIVILDEVQAIPHKYWLLINKTLNFLAKHFSVYIILITATQPLIFNESVGELKPLVKDKERFFRMLNRVDLEFNPKDTTIVNFEGQIKEDIIKNPEKDVLVVMNTISTSKKIYKFIQDIDLKNCEITYLSTNIIPKERLSRIRMNNAHLKKEKRRVIVSTQLIEAGVDLDVDIVYRDLGPLDSINQVSGRCNRNFLYETGVVKIFILKDEETKRYYYNPIYDDFVISRTINVLEKQPRRRISEKDFLSLNEEYFEKVRLDKSDDQSNDFIKCTGNLSFDNLSKFSLIEEDYQKIEVFVETDEKAKDLWKKYLELRKIKNPLERKKEFLKIKKDFYDNVISVSEKFKNEVGYSEDTYMGHISLEEVAQGNLYDAETGFKGKDSDGGTRSF